MVVNASPVHVISITNRHLSDQEESEHKHVIYIYVCASVGIIGDG